MTLVAAAVCPHPPVLVPAVGAGEPVAAREPALVAVRWLLAQDAQMLVVVGDGPATAYLGAGATGTFEGFGVRERVTLGPGGRDVAPGPPTLPLSISVGAWLVAAAGGLAPGVEICGFAVDAAVPPAAAAEHGARLAGLAGRVAMLVMGDGSARRTPKAPGGFDERALPFDAAASAALAAADPGALLALDPRAARELLAAGRASWQVLAGAAGKITDGDVHPPSRPVEMTEMPGGSRRSLPALCRSVVIKPWIGYVTYDDAPYGVGYLVATWEQGDLANHVRTDDG